MWRRKESTVSCDCLDVARSMEGALWWGAFAALDQWCIPHRLGKPQTSRPTDADLVAAAGSGGLQTDLLKRFAMEYQVFRLPLNLMCHREERLAAVGTAVHNSYYSVGAEPGPEDLARMWWTAISQVRLAMEPFGRTADLKSFCMKSLWLYYPAQATMWDSFVVRALNTALGTRHNNSIASEHEAAAFLVDFERLFAEQQPLINRILDDVQTLTGKRYAYPRRVLDKALWLLGEVDDAAVVKIAFLLLGTDPQIRMATKQRFAKP
jgi:hypothetical protein